MKLDHGLLISAGAVFGSLITKVLTHRQRTHQIKIEEATQIRKELRLDVVQLHEKIDKLSIELDRWKDRYYKLSEENVDLRTRCRTLELEVEDLRRKIPGHVTIEEIELESPRT